MSQASNGDTVRIHYIGTLKDGTEFDSSAGRDPLEFTLGEQSILPTLEASILGMAVGDTAKVDIAAADAYGPRIEEAVQVIERSMIPEEITVTVGNQVQAKAPDGQTLVFTIIDADDQTVTLDGNHPLAGEDLTFDIELVEILA